MVQKPLLRDIMLTCDDLDGQERIGFLRTPIWSDSWSPRLQRQHPQEALLHRSEREHGGVRYVEIIVSNNGEAATELPQREIEASPTSCASVP
jgi:hypothetical protein